MKILKRLAVVLLILIVAFITYVEIINRNSKEMNYRQKVLKAVYPAWMWWTKVTGKNTKTLKENKEPMTSFYDLKAIKNDGTEFDFSSLRGKKVMIVNTASACGYTNQYEDLQRLYEEKGHKLEILAFPANDFKEQEKGSDEEIAQFCKLNFGVTFPLMKKSTVVRSPEQNAVFKWLTDPLKNGWNEKEPSWNFSKYLVDENGKLTNYFDPSISPSSEEVRSALD